METVGAERDGWTRRKAEAELRERLVRVERKAYTRPKRLTFAEYVEAWFEEGRRRRDWKPRTLLAYRTALRHLEAVFGPVPLGAIRPRDVTAYVADALADFAPKTVNLHLNVLHDVLNAAIGEELIDRNPVDGVERPRVRRRRWRILASEEVARVSRAFTDEQARTLFLTLVLTGLPGSSSRRCAGATSTSSSASCACVSRSPRRGSAPSRSPPLSPKRSGSSGAVPPSRATTSGFSATRRAAR
jgi:hypothetical protein